MYVRDQCKNDILMLTLEKIMDIKTNLSTMGILIDLDDLKNIYRNLTKLNNDIVNKLGKSRQKVK